MSLVRDHASRGKRRGRPRSRSAPALLRSPKKTKKRKQGAEESMQAALGAVKSGVSVLQVAREHGVPRQTLRDRVSGRWNCHTVLLWDHRLQDCRLALQQWPLREEEATNLDQPSTLTNSACATAHLRRTDVNVLDQSGWSVFARGGCMKTVCL